MATTFAPDPVLLAEQTARRAHTCRHAVTGGQECGKPATVECVCWDGFLTYRCDAHRDQHDDANADILQWHELYS